MIWSFALAAIGIFGLWLAGKEVRAGWLIGLVAQVLWIIYALFTRQYGFILSSLGYAFVYFKNARAFERKYRESAKG